MLASMPSFRTLVLCAALLSPACEHGEGGPCQVDRDCDDGLVCNVEDTDATHGVCGPREDDAGTSGPVVDPPLKDAGGGGDDDDGGAADADGG